MQKNRLRQCSVKATYNSVARKILALSFILFSCCGCVAVAQEETTDPVSPDQTEDNENKNKEMKWEIEYNLHQLNRFLEIMDKGFLPFGNN